MRILSLALISSLATLPALASEADHQRALCQGMREDEGQPDIEAARTV